ncbi:MAG TPA: hypothetical protein VH834_00450 [Solirubrobacteraceae bacterium]
MTAVGSFWGSGTSVAAGAAAPLTTAGSGNTAGAFTITANTVTVVQAGTYLLTYSAAIGSGNAVLQLVVNSNLVPGTLGGTSSSGTRMLSGSAAVTLTANSTVLVRNVLATAVTLSGVLGTQTPTSVSLSILRVG